ncbi:PEGA domain-containing protein [bacterium]|nr:PEGA domain-containing protein [bacterium]
MKPLLLLLMLAFVTANVLSQGKKTTVAVLDFQSTGDLDKKEVATLTNRFRNILVKTRAFEVVEREKMNEVLKAQDFNISDACNTAECAVQVGQLLGVQAMMAGDLGKIGETFTIDLRMVDVATGKILQTQTEDYVGKLDGLLGVMQSMANAFAGTVETRVAVRKFNLTVTTALPANSKGGDIGIFIDGHQAGQNKVTLSLAEGKHSLLVKTDSPDFNEFRQDINLTADQKIEAKLEFSESYKTRMAGDAAKAAAAKELAAKEKADREKAKAQSGDSKGGSKKLWYIIGGAAVLGGGAAVLLGGGGGGGTKSLKINNPVLPPNP